MRKNLLFRNLPVFLMVCLGLGGLSCNERNTQALDDEKNSKEIRLPGNSSQAMLIFEAGELSGMFSKDTRVLLTVDTENITEEAKNDYVTISDDRSDPSQNSGSPSEHVALVDKNMKIYWSAEALNPGLGISIDVLGIFRKAEGGAEILEGVFRDPNKDGIIMGKIKNKKVEGLEYYNIMIRINEESPRTFVIDPKLKMSD